MKDMVNERDLVCRKIASFNFDAVNAESWLPGGTSSWEKIKNEIASSHVFALLLGDRYGWIPDKGPGSEHGLSVTHMEYQEARDRGLPVLVFEKQLIYDSERGTPDAQKRDAFRLEVREWSTGYFLGKPFLKAYDLSEQVGQALVELLSHGFIAEQIRTRAAATIVKEEELDRKEKVAIQPSFSIPEALIRAVADRKAVLFAGAGISMSAGLPSATAFTEYLTSAAGKKSAGYYQGTSATSFAAVASDVEALFGRDFLVAQVANLLDPPQGIKPTSSHSAAVMLFDIILTTNWDRLFEIAAAESRVELKTIVGELNEKTPSRALFKLHGSIDDSSSLLLTESNVLGMDWTRPKLWSTAQQLISDRPLVIVGSSLRDPSLIRLFQTANRRSVGYMVSPRLSSGDEARLKHWNIAWIPANSDNFFSALGSELLPIPPPL